MKVNAKYVSEWDGSTLIESNCDFNTETNTVSNIEVVNVEDYDIVACTDEYVELNDGTKIRDFEYFEEDYM